MANLILNEGRFMFNFTSCVNAFTADKPQYNGLSAVDFIVETDEKFLFIEIKDPDNPQAQKFKNAKNFIEELESPAKISGKFKDSLLKELAKGETFVKPIEYILVLECESLNSAQRHRIFTQVSCAVPQFKEAFFPAIKSASFSLFDITSFQKSFPLFKVTQTTL